MKLRNLRGLLVVWIRQPKPRFDNQIARQKLKKSRDMYNYIGPTDFLAVSVFLKEAKYLLR